MTSFDNGEGPEGLVRNLIEKAAKGLDEMSDTAGEIAPDVGDLASFLVDAQRIADKAAQDLHRLAKKVPGPKAAA
jgi:hypothetical protein